MDLADHPAVRVTRTFWSLCADQRFDDAFAMMHEDFVHDDRRAAMTNTIIGREETMANNRIVIEMGLTTIRVEPLEVRGDRHVVARMTYRSDRGDEVVALQVLEIDDDGLRTCCVSFDTDDLEGARRELVRRFDELGRSGATDAAG